MFVFFAEIAVNIETVTSIRPHLYGDETVGILMTHLDGSKTVIHDFSMDDVKNILDEHFGARTLKSKWPARQRVIFKNVPRTDSVPLKPEIK